MSAFLYGTALQLKLDIRSKTMLITCYIVPLIFYAFMGAIFTSIDPEARNTLIQSMTVFVISMGALVGLPPSLVEIYGSDIKNVYKANGVPLYLGIASSFISAFIHLMIMCLIILITAPIAFDAVLPVNIPLHFVSLAIFTTVSLSIGCVLGLLSKNQSKLNMYSQIIFLPSIMLSGIMFPIDLLPKAFEYIGMIFPASWGNLMMTSSRLEIKYLLPLAVIFIASITVTCIALIKKAKL